MFPINRLAVIFIFSMVVSAQEDPLMWFPLRVGTRWVYDHEAKSGDRSRPDVDRWTTEETITGRVAVPEGLVVLREVKQETNSTEPTATYSVIAPNGQVRFIQQKSNTHAYPSSRDREPYLVHGDCVCRIGGGWDTETRQLRSDYRQYLSEGSLSPDFCFPLQLGRAWGNNDIPWQVEPVRGGVASFLPPDYAGAIHIFSSHFGSGGWQDVWFQKSIGVVGEHYIHNGTYEEYTKKLRSFLP